jgi:hypothetical protein
MEKVKKQVGFEGTLLGSSVCKRNKTELKPFKNLRK